MRIDFALSSMPTQFFPLTTLTQIFEDETVLSEAICFDEISRFNTTSENSVYDVRLNIEQILKDLFAQSFYSRISPPEIELSVQIIKLAPPKKTNAWRDEIDIKFHILHWKRDDGYAQAYVPALGIGVLSKKNDDFQATIRKEILAALQRNGFAKSLHELRLLERVKDVNLEISEIAIDLKTTKQRAIAEEKDEEDEKSVLEEIGINLAKSELKTAYEVEKQVEILAGIFRGNEPQSVLLVGESGVGKTAVFNELARQREKFLLSKNEFWATSGARLIAGQSGFGMWQERTQKLIKEAKKRCAIIHLGNLIELLEVGKSNSSMQGIASFLRPKIARGEIQVVVECTPEQLPIIERRDPNLLGAFQQIRIEEPTRQTGLKILEFVAKEFAQVSTPENREIETEAIKAVDAIHRRYSTYSAFPSRPVRFLRNIFTELERGEPLSSQQVIKTFANETGLPEFLLNDEISFDANATKNFFAEKVIGQMEAVNLICDLITTVKMKLTRPRKPIASLLFIGPTGVGKTEMVKSLAEFFFRDKARMIRFDMSEFSNPLAVQRLIGGTGETEGLLTAKVREQPFSVILLDEFEKADGSFFDLLLQILGEGRLTDSVGRVADFTNSIIVMTSNLGASEFQRGKSGFLHDKRQRKATIQHFTNSVREFLRPEIFNRIDRIVPFAPLDEKTVGKITELEIEKLKKRDGLRFRQINLNVEKNALSYLTEKGYDIRYGARPLKRTIERELLAPLSTALNLRLPDEKLTVNIGLNDEKFMIDFLSEAPQKKRATNDFILASNAEKCAILRRQTQKFLSCYKMTELRDEIYQLVRLHGLEARGKWLSQEDKDRLATKIRIENFLENSKKFSEKISEIEDEILLEIYGKTFSETQRFGQSLSENEELFRKLLLELLSYQYQNPNEVKLSLFCENSGALFRLARSYLYCAEHFGGDTKEVLAFTSEKQSDKEAEPKLLFSREVWRKEITDFDKFFAGSPKEIVGILIRIEGDLALPRFGAESGIHSFVIGSQVDRVLVNQTDAKFTKFALSDDLVARDSIKHQFNRRIYNASLPIIKDLVLEKEFDFDGKVIAQAVADSMHENLLKTAENLIE